MNGRLWMGTSGWTYASWRGTYYPDDLPSRRYLEFYSREFPTTEVNYSFYHLPDRRLTSTGPSRCRRIFSLL